MGLTWPNTFQLGYLLCLICFQIVYASSKMKVSNS